MINDRAFRRYLEAAITIEHDTVSNSEPGERNAQLYQSSLALFRFCRLLNADPNPSTTRLLDAALLVELPEAEARQVIEQAKTEAYS